MTAPLDEKHPFSVTLLFRYNSDNDSFVKIGNDILSALPEDIEEIGRDNYVYLPYVFMEKTRLSQGCYKELGAIVVGTTNKEIAESLHFVLMRNQIGK